MLGGAQDGKGEGRMILDKIQGQAAQAYVLVASWSLSYRPLSRLIPPLRVPVHTEQGSARRKGQARPTCPLPTY